MKDATALYERCLAALVAAVGGLIRGRRAIVWAAYLGRTCAGSACARHRITRYSERLATR